MVARTIISAQRKQKLVDVYEFEASLNLSFWIRAGGREILYSNKWSSGRHQSNVMGSISVNFPESQWQ